LETHHDACAVRIFHVVDRIWQKIPTYSPRGIDDRVLRIEGPFNSASGWVIPDEAGTFGRSGKEVVDEIETILIFWINFDNCGVKHSGLKRRAAVHFTVNGWSINLVGLFDVFFLAFCVDTGIGHFYRVHVVRIESEDRNASMSHNFFRGDLVADFLTVLFRYDANGNIFKFVSAIADDSG